MARQKGVNQILEDMLRACALAYSQKWDECLPLAEFAYNNSYQESIRMAPFEALYGRKCRTPLNWSEAGEKTFFGRTALLRKYRKPHPTPGASRVVAESWDAYVTFGGLTLSSADHMSLGWFL